MDIIQDIRRGHGFDCEAVSSNSPLMILRGKLERACERLSIDLYNKRTHFLLEFIQNADDNQYPESETPMLRICLRGGRIVLMCNEAGFTEADVRAICDVGQSTKVITRSRTGQGYIGEKGIGFKSVFTVADVVQISSRQFQFHFDKRAPLGMITPVWDATCPTTTGWTTFTLSPSANESSKGLMQEIVDIKPSLLLFLRKLEAVGIDFEADGVDNSSYKSRPTKTVDIKREIRGKFTVLTRSVNSILVSSELYFVVKHIAPTFTEEPKRLGIVQTEVILAFPVDEQGVPAIDKHQDVHAFLPLRSYGFSFVIQADFLTATSREDILISLQWNQVLFDRVVDAFLVSVDALNEDENLWMNWFRFLPQYVLEPFVLVERRVFSALRSRRVIRSIDGTFRAPPRHVIVPNRFCDDNGEPLIPTSHLPTNIHYLSKAYPMSPSDKLLLMSLGVQEVTVESFLDCLVGMGADLHKMSDDWHERVCRILYTVPFQRLKEAGGYRTTWNPKILQLPILPLEDGSWTKASEAATCMFNLRDTQIPEDVGIRSISAKIRGGSARHTLYRSLGVRPANVDHIVATITSASDAISPEALVQHTFFLFHQRYNCVMPDLSQFRVISDKAVLSRGCQLHLDVPELRNTLPISARFVHPIYMAACTGSERQDWLRWLEEKLRIHVIPRVIDHTTGMLSPEFKLMADALRPSKFLDMLRRYWAKVSTDPNAVAQISETRILCEDNEKYPIKFTALRRDALAQYPLAHFLPISDPINPKWDFLTDLGVTIEPNLGMFVKALVHLQEAGSLLEEAVLALYRQLDARFYDDPKEVLDAFAKPLIFIPANGGGPCWKYWNDIYWDAPSSMARKPAIKPFYKELEGFFKHKLGVPSATPEEFVDEVTLFSVQNHGRALDEIAHSRATQILVDINDLIRASHDLQNTDYLCLARLKAYPIFPISSPAYPSWCFLAVPIEFYVPDKNAKLADAFKPYVCLLALSTPFSMHSIQAVLDSNFWTFKMLEQSVMTSWEYEGLPHPRPDVGGQYTTRVNFIERLVQHHDHAQVTLYMQRTEKLRKLNVYKVHSITAAHYLHPTSVRFEEELKVEEGEESLNVYVCKSPSHLAICTALGPLLGLDALALLTVIKENYADINAWLRNQGIPEVDVTSIPERRQPWHQLERPQPGQSVAEEPALNGHERSPPTQSLLPRVLPRLNTSEWPSLRRSYQPTQKDLRGITEMMRRVRINTGEIQQHAVFAEGERRRRGGGPDVELLRRLRDEDEGAEYTATRDETINGIFGETFVFHLLSKLLGKDFGVDNWTSELRENYSGFPPFAESALADFTVQDKQGVLTVAWFGRARAYAWRAQWPTYHLEVKTTSGNMTEPFSLSRSQLATALQLTFPERPDDSPTDIYGIIRVANISDEPRWKVYLDPLGLLVNEQLRIVSAVNIQVVE